jgi:hypothetical protein
MTKRWGGIIGAVFGMIAVRGLADGAVALSRKGGSMCPSFPSPTIRRPAVDEAATESPGAVAGRLITQTRADQARTATQRRTESRLMRLGHELGCAGYLALR